MYTPIFPRPGRTIPVRKKAKNQPPLQAELDDIKTAWRFPRLRLRLMTLFLKTEVKTLSVRNAYNLTDPHTNPESLTLRLFPVLDALLCKTGRGEFDSLVFSGCEAAVSEGRRDADRRASKVYEQLEQLLKLFSHALALFAESENWNGRPRWGRVRAVTPKTSCDTVITVSAAEASEIRWIVGEGPHLPREAAGRNCIVFLLAPKARSIRLSSLLLTMPNRASRFLELTPSAAARAKVNEVKMLSSRCSCATPEVLMAATGRARRGDHVLFMCQKPEVVALVRETFNKLRVQCVDTAALKMEVTDILVWDVRAYPDARVENETLALCTREAAELDKNGATRPSSACFAVLSAGDSLAKYSAAALALGAPWAGDNDAVVTLL